MTYHLESSTAPDGTIVTCLFAGGRPIWTGAGFTFAESLRGLARAVELGSNHATTGTTATTGSNGR